MTRKQGYALNLLVRLARGNTELVDEAIRECSKGTRHANLDEVSRYILKNLEPYKGVAPRATAADDGRNTREYA